MVELLEVHSYYSLERVYVLIVFLDLNLLRAVRLDVHKSILLYFDLSGLEAISSSQIHVFLLLRPKLYLRRLQQLVGSS